MKSAADGTRASRGTSRSRVPALLAGVVVACACFAALPALAQERPPGSSVDELLAIARERTPELAVMRLEAFVEADPAAFTSAACSLDDG